MGTDKFYKISKYVIFSVYFSIFFAGLIIDLHDSQGDSSSFMENPVVMEVLALCVFLFGIHVIIFRDRWARYNNALITKYPSFIRLFTLTVAPIYYVFAGIFAMAIAVLLFLASFSY